MCIISLLGRQTSFHFDISSYWSDTIYNSSGNNSLKSEPFSGIQIQLSQSWIIIFFLKKKLILGVLRLGITRHLILLHDLWWSSQKKKKTLHGLIVNGRIRPILWWSFFNLKPWTDLLLLWTHPQFWPFSGEISWCHLGFNGPVPFHRTFRSQNSTAWRRSCLASPLFLLKLVPSQSVKQFQFHLK